MKRIISAILIVFTALSIANAEPSLAEKIVTIDTGRWGTVKKHDVTRVQSLFTQLTAKYKLTETKIADQTVYVTHSLLRDKFGITQKLQDSLEDLNRVQFPKPQSGDFTKLAVAYAYMRNTGQPREEVIKRLNLALAMDSRALDKIANQ